MGDNAEIGTSDRFAEQHGGAQPLVGVHRVRRRDDQSGSIRFFLRASARSKLRRCTLTWNRSLIASRHCGVVSSGFAIRISVTKATTSAEILWPPLGPRWLGTRPTSPAAARAPWAL